MESQQDLLQSQTSQEEQPQEGSPQQDLKDSLLAGLQQERSQEGSQEPPPQQDQESSQELSELAPETVETTEQVEPEVDAADIVPEAEQPSVEDSGQQEEQKIEFSSFEDVNIDSIPDNVQPYVKPILDLASSYVAGLQEEKSKFETARNEFNELMDSIRTSEDIKPLVSRLETQQSTIDEMTKDIVSTSWRAFNNAHPELVKLPQKARAEFASQLEHIYERFEGDSLVDKMEDAYKYSLYRSGVDLNTVSATSVPDEKLESRKPDPVAIKQSVVADGHVAHGQPVRSVDEMEWGEVLGRYDYLLDS